MSCYYRNDTELVLTVKGKVFNSGKAQIPGMAPGEDPDSRNSMEFILFAGWWDFDL